MKRIIFIISILVAAICYSQTVSIEGKVLSAQDKLPISEVNILIKGTTIGTSTDNNGNYQINNVKLPCEIEFSHLNYFTQNRKLSKKDIKNGKIHLDIYLNEKIQTLDEFVVTDNKLHLIASDIMDYDLSNNNIFALKNKGKTIEIYNSFGNLITKNKFNQKFDILGKDSKGKIKLSNKDSLNYYILDNHNNNLTLQRIPFDSIEVGVIRMADNADKYFFKEDKTKDFYHYWIYKYSDTVRKPKTSGTNIYMPEFYIHEVNLYERFPTWSIKIEKVYNKNTYFSINCSWCKNMNTLCKVYYDSIAKDIRFKVVYFNEYDCDDWIMPQIDGKLIVYENKTYNKENFELMMGNKSEELIEKVCTKWWNVHLKNKKFHNNKKSSVFFKFDEDFVYIFNFYKHIIYKLDKEFHLLQTVNINETISTPNDVLITGNQCYILYEKHIEQLDLSCGKQIQTIKLLLPNVSNIKILDNNIYYIKPMPLYNSVTVNNLYLQEM